MQIYKQLRGLFDNFNAGGRKEGMFFTSEGSSYVMHIDRNEEAYIESFALKILEMKAVLPELMEIAVENGIVRIEFNSLTKDLDRQRKNTPFTIEGVSYMVGTKKDSVIVWVSGTQIKDKNKWGKIYKEVFGVDSEISYLTI